MTKENHIRYSRLIAVEGVGSEGVEKLNNSTVVVVGCGALGSMVAMQLAASGIGTIKIVDFDSIDISNLQRQFFFRTDEAGMKKADILATRIRQLNPDIQVITYNAMLNRENAPEIIADCDFVVEATDNPSSMLVIDRICMGANVKCVLAGVSGFSGQVITCIPGGRRYADIFPDAGADGVMPCSLGGVAGPAAAIAASIQAAEVIKSIAGLGNLLSDKILVFDLTVPSFNIINT